MTARLFLLDAHALCYRCFYAIKGLSTSKGQATNAIFGFVNALRKILRDYKPEYMAVCFDSKQKTHRQERFNAYKIQRPAMPADLADQMPFIKEIVQAYNLTLLECGGFEADDIIATVSQGILKAVPNLPAGEAGGRQRKNSEIEVVIVSDDKDMYQLASQNIAFFSARKGMFWEYEQLREYLGFDPHHITDFIALAGDKADNIPGVKGIGEVTARNLINQYGSLEYMLDHLESIRPEAVQKKLRQNREAAVLSKELAVLETNVPVDFDLNKLRVRSPDYHRLKGIFNDLEFGKFVRELACAMPAPHYSGAGQEDKKEELVTSVRLLKTKEDIGTFMRVIKQKGEFAFSLDDAGASGSSDFKGILLSAGTDEVFSVPLTDLDSLKEIFTDRTVVKITFHLKEAVKIFAAWQCVLEGKVFDVMLAGYLLGTAPFLSSGGQEALPLEGGPFSASLAKGEAAPKIGELCALYAKMSAELKQKSLEDLLDNIETPLAYVLAEMETCGVNLNTALLRDLSKECERRMQNLTGELYAIAGEELNLNSPKQLSHILFTKLKLPTLKRTKTGFSTNEEVLTVLAQSHEFPSFLLEYRQLSKLKSTYIDALPALVNPETGRIHARFHQTRTETGRLSSSQPNLQNIPIRTELGRQVRRAIIPLCEGHSLIAADYSQIELRILAHLSQDQNLIRAFHEDQDIHAFTASLIFSVAEKDVTFQMRDMAKRVNFGIIYGMSAFGLAKDLGMREEEAQEFIDKYFLRYPRVKDFMENTIRQCEERGFVTTLLNRRRYIPQITSTNNSMRLFAQRQAINTPVQGSAADMIKLAMVHIHREIENRALASRMLITVHDELVLDVPPGETDETIHLVRHCMEGALTLTVPVKVSIKRGPNWLDMEDV
jgi:DNA polymerase-1